MNPLSAPAAWIDLLVVTDLVAVGVLGVRTKNLDPSPRRGVSKFWTTVAFGWVFILSSMDTIWTRHIAPRSAMTGTVHSIRHTGGKNPRTSFRLLDGNGGYFRLTADTSGLALEDGATVSAEWTNYNAEVMRFHVLSGSHKGAQFDDTIPFGSIVSALVGLLFVGGAYTQRRRNPLGHPPPEAQSRAAGIVDEDSLLHLNRK